MSEAILRREEYESSDVTFALNLSEDRGCPSFSHLMVRGWSPPETPQTVLVRIDSARPSWKEKGSIMGGTIDRKRDNTYVKHLEHLTLDHRFGAFGDYIYIIAGAEEELIKTKARKK